MNNPLAEKHMNGDWEGVRGLLGGKGANLAEMVRIGVPVPPGFRVTTETWEIIAPREQP